MLTRNSYFFGLHLMPCMGFLGIEMMRLLGGSEINDFKQILQAIEELSDGAIATALRPLLKDIERIMENPFCK